MQIEVHTLCAYYAKDKQISTRHIDSTNFCLAVKNDSTKVNFLLPNEREVSRNNAHIARAYFGNEIRRIVKELDLENYQYIPVPSKCSFTDIDFRTLKMLREGLGRIESAKINPFLKFKESVVPASRGGPRGYNEMLSRLTSSGMLGERGAILVDDIVTQGGTMLACKTMIEKYGGRVLAAIACGRADDNEPSPFKRKAVFFDAADQWDLFK